MTGRLARMWAALRRTFAKGKVGEPQLPASVRNATPPSPTAPSSKRVDDLALKAVRGIKGTGDTAAIQIGLKVGVARPDRDFMKARQQAKRKRKLARQSRNFNRMKAKGKL